MLHETAITYPTEQEQKYALRRQVAAWQRAAIGLLGLSLAMNVAGGMYMAQECKRYALELESLRLDLQFAQAMRDQAVTQLGAVERDKQSALDELVEMALASAQEQQERREQAEAYTALGEYSYIGECEITAYCCECYEHICGTGDGLTATGIPVTPGVCAVDPDVIPFGSTVIINGRRYLAADTGAAIKGNRIDLAVPTHEGAEKFGVCLAEVWIVAPGSKKGSEGNG